MAFSFCRRVRGCVSLTTLLHNGPAMALSYGIGSVPPCWCCREAPLKLRAHFLFYFNRDKATSASIKTRLGNKHRWHLFILLHISSHTVHFNINLKAKMILLQEVHDSTIA